MIVTDERVASFVSHAIKAPIVPPFTCMGVEQNGRIVSGVILNCFTVHDIEVTVAGHFFPRALMRRVHDYVFHELGCLRISCTTEQPEVVRLAERFGGTVEGLKRDFYGKGRDAFLVGILRDDWRIR